MPTGYSRDSGGTTRFVPTQLNYWYNASSQSTKYVYSNLIILPDGRTANNGLKPILVSEIGAYAGGFGGLSRTCTLELIGSDAGNAGSSSQFSLPASSQAAYTGLKPLSVKQYFSNGSAGSGLFTIFVGGNAYIGTIPGSTVYPYLLLGNPPNQTTVDQNSSPKGLWATVTYAQVPSTPSLSISANGPYGFSASWNTPDWGDSSSGRGFELYVGSYSNTNISSGSTSLSLASAGLSPNTTYTATLYAKNELANYSGSPKSVAATASFTTAAVPKPTWSGSFSNGQVGTGYNDSVIATGATSVSGSLSPTGKGLSGFVNGTSYVVQGTPTANGTYSVSVSATNDGGTTTGSYSFSVSPPPTPTWPDTTFKDGNAGQSYGSDSITASNADYVTVSPSSIAGLTASASGSTITLSGTPDVSADGSYTLSAIAYSVPDNGTRISTPATLSVFINGIPQPTWQDTTIDTQAAINIPYSSNVSATNTTSYSFVGNYPTWLSLNTSTGELSGTPTYTDVTYDLSDIDKQFTIRATGSGGESVDFTFGGIDVVHPIKIYKDASGQFEYPSSHVRRRGGSTYSNVQWVKRYNGTSWVDADLT